MIAELGLDLGLDEAADGVADGEVGFPDQAIMLRGERRNGAPSSGDRPL